MNLDYPFASLINKTLDEIQSEKIFDAYFSISDLEQIGPDFYLGNKEKGVCLVFDRDKVVKGAQFFDEGAEPEYAKFQGELPFKLEFDDTEKEAQAKIGVEPSASAASQSDAFFGSINAWKKYKFDDCFLRIEFNEKGRIPVVSLANF